MLTVYPYTSLSNGLVWHAPYNLDLHIKDIKIVSEGIVHARVASGRGADLLLELVWISSDLAYGPHWDITWIYQECDSIETWKAHMARVEAVFPMARV